MRILLLLLILPILGCSGLTSDPEPVSLPVPYSGSFSPDSEVVVANGQSPDKSIKGVFLNQVFGLTFPAFDSLGTAIGTLSLDFQNASPIETCGDKKCFTLPLTIVYNDGSNLRVNSMQFYDFPYDPAAEIAGAPNPPPIQDFGPNAYATKGVASGVITTATGPNKDVVNHLLDYRYVHIWTGDGSSPNLEEIFFGTVIIYR